MALRDFASIIRASSPACRARQTPSEPISFRLTSNDNFPGYNFCMAAASSKPTRTESSDSRLVISQWMPSTRRPAHGPDTGRKRMG